MEEKVKVFIVDDHDMFRQGVKVLLGKSNKTEIIGEASNGQLFIDILPSIDPDVVLMDISMPVLDGIETTFQALQIRPELKVLTLSMFGEEEYYYKMIQAGVRGFVMKSAGIEELEFSIHQVAKGSAYFSEELMEIVRQNMGKSAPEAGHPGFSQREIVFLKSVASNMSDADIAQEMNEPPEALMEIQKDLLKKTNSVNTSGLILYAIKNKIVTI